MSTREPDPAEEPDDDAALHWEGDEARGQAAPRMRAPGPGDPDDGPQDADDEPEPVPPRGPGELALLVATGVLAAVYLAMSVGWIVSAQMLVYPGLDLFGEIMWQFGEFLSMIAPALWFAAAFTLTPEGSRRRGVRRIVALLIGVLVLVPWPALLGVLG